MNALVFVFSFYLFFIMISKMVYSAGGASVSGSQSGGNGGPVIVELPLDKIRRPLMRTRANDPHKVKELMDSIQEIGLQVPVSILLFNFLLHFNFFLNTGVFFFLNNCCIECLCFVWYARKWMGILVEFGQLKVMLKLEDFTTRSLRKMNELCLFVCFFFFG